MLCILSSIVASPQLITVEPIRFEMNNSWLLGFLCQLTYWWWVESIWMWSVDLLVMSREYLNVISWPKKLIHSFWNALRIRRKINQLHQSSFYTSSIYYNTQSNPWICRYRFNRIFFLIFFCITPHTGPHTRKIKKSRMN
jgi:Zn-dependent protease with chaperone function